MTAELPMVRTDTSNAFAHHTMSIRLPGIVREVAAINADYPPPVKDALKRLADDMENDREMPMLDLPAPDYDDWRAAHDHYTRREGRTWQQTAWFFAETFCYRHVIQAVRWWETGRDPFLPHKMEEYAGTTPWELLERASAVNGAPEERLALMLDFALWGNRIDLSYTAAAAHGAHVQDDDLLVDDRAAIAAYLHRQPGVVHIIADNAGTELLMDLALIGELLESQPQVFLHLKFHPTFVSDATAEDARWLIEHLRGRGLPLGDRLAAALDAGRLRLAPDLFWNSSRLLREMPPRLAGLFAGARLLIFKGDANYRRLSGDVLWPPATPFGVMTGYLPVPAAALRTLKSDTIAGLPPGLAERLDADDPLWRSNGRRGVAQAALP